MPLWPLTPPPSGRCCQSSALCEHVHACPSHRTCVSSRGAMLQIVCTWDFFWCHLHVMNPTMFVLKQHYAHFLPDNCGFQINLTNDWLVTERMALLPLSKLALYSQARVLDVEVLLYSGRRVTGRQSKLIWSYTRTASRWPGIQRRMAPQLLTRCNWLACYSCI